MSTTQRVSRGFHRLGLFLAAIPMLIGAFISVLKADWSAPWSANDMSWTVGASVDAKIEAECQSDIAQRGMAIASKGPTWVLSH